VNHTETAVRAQLDQRQAHVQEHLTVLIKNLREHLDRGCCEPLGLWVGAAEALFREFTPEGCAMLLALAVHRLAEAGTGVAE
jgi:hypothetical protein